MGTTQPTGTLGGTSAASSTSADALLPELAATTDLAGLIERVIGNDLPCVVVPAATLRAWEERDPVGWAKVSDWLAVNGVAVIHL